jgi:hypothetical protein
MIPYTSIVPLVCPDWVVPWQEWLMLIPESPRSLSLLRRSYYRTKSEAGLTDGTSHVHRVRQMIKQHAPVFGQRRLRRRSTVFVFPLAARKRKC